MRLIVTDLDGTLIDHHTYSAEPARPALDAAARAGVPVVLCSSKTLAEMTALARDLALEPAPLIVENGGAIWFPPAWPAVAGATTSDQDEGSVLVLGARAEALRQLLPRVAADTGAALRGFSAMTDEEVARRTGLALPVASLARRRWYSEPFVCEGDADLGALDRVARAHGARVTRGGRFFHLTGPTDKGRAVHAVRATCPPDARLLGLGDAPNDIALLLAVDDAVIVPQPTGLHPDVVAAVPHARHAAAPGPAGWRAAVVEWLGS